MPVVFWWHKDGAGNVIDPTTTSPYGPEIRDFYNKMRVLKVSQMEGRTYVDLKACREVPRRYKGQYSISKADLTQMGVIWAETLPDGKRLLDKETFQLYEGVGQTTRRRRRDNDNLSSSADEEEDYDAEADKEEEEGAAPALSFTTRSRVPQTHASGRRRSGETINESQQEQNNSIERETHVLCLTPTSKTLLRNDVDWSNHEV